MRARRPVERLVVPIAAWMHCIRAQAVAGRPIVDPLHENLIAYGLGANGNAQHDLRRFLELPGVFPSDLAQRAEFTRAVAAGYELLGAHGALSALTMSA